MQTATNIFKRASITYYYSSLFFPANVAKEVADFYAFVRTADDFVDQQPSDGAGFTVFCETYLQAFRDGFLTGDVIIDAFLELQRKYDIPVGWIQAFFWSMASDIDHQPIETRTDILKYMYGSAEIIGLCLAKILGLPEASYPAARMQGRAMQYINIIRDIAEDRYLQRSYIPADILASFGFTELSPEIAQQSSARFKALIRQEIQRYRMWQQQADQGYRYIPYRYRVPIRTATRAYEWTAEEIYRNPMIVWQKKVKPKPMRVVRIGAQELLYQVARSSKV